MSSLDLSSLTQAITQDDAGGLSGEAYPLEDWHPSTCGVMDLVIKHDGSWWHNGSEIKRQKLVLLFSKVLIKEDGCYYLKTPVEKIEISVQDAAFSVVDYEIEKINEDKPRILLITNIGDKVPVSETFTISLEGEEQRPYLSLWRGLSARVNRAVYYALVELALSQSGEGEHLWLSSGSHRMNLGKLC